MLNLLFNGVVSTSLSVSAVILTIFILRPLLERHLRAGAACLVWALIAARLLIPLAPSKPPQIAIPISIGQNAEASDSVTVSPYDVNLSEPKSASVKDSGFSSANLPSVIWLCGMAASLSYQAASYLHMKRRLSRWSIAVSDKLLLDTLKECAESQGITQEVKLRRSANISSPMLVGIISREIFLPDMPLSQTQAEYVFRHELCHLRRRDLWLKLLLMLVRSVHWFNPLVWLASRRAAEEIECACDEEIIRSGSSRARREYCEVILSFLQADRQGFFPLTTGFFEGRNQIIRRFERIMDTRKKHRGIFCIALVAAAVLFGGNLIGCVQAQASDSKTVVQELSAEEKMVWPATECLEIAEQYGDRYDGTDFHSGIDITCKDSSEAFGTPVVAAADGTVVYVNDKYAPGNGYGKYIVIDHGNELTTLYGQLSEQLVQKGDKVTAGQEIGKVGSTGKSTGPHLHFEVRQGGEMADPMEYLFM